MQAPVQSFSSEISTYNAFPSCKITFLRQQSSSPHKHTTAWYRYKGVNRDIDNKYNIHTMNEPISNPFRHTCDEVVSSESDTVQRSIEDSNKWSITSQNLKVIPPYYPLDLTHKVVASTTIETVNQRISQCVKLYDLAIKWCARDPSILYCSTNGLLSFEINLWKKIDFESNQEEAKTSSIIIDMIVEIRRHDGDCVRFHHLRNVLYGAICRGEFLDLNEVYDDRGRIRPINKSPIKKNKNAPRFLRPLTFDTLMDVMNSVAMAFEMIFNQTSFDTTMGLQMLVFLTDSSSIQRVYAGHVCDFILTGFDVFGNDVAAAPDVIHNFITTEKESIEHHYALKILANVFENNSYSEEIPQSILEQIESWNSVLPSLIIDIKNVVKNPHVAYNGLKCLRQWYLFAGSIADTSYVDEILESLDAIQTYGNQWYISIEKEASTLRLLLVNNS